MAIATHVMVGPEDTVTVLHDGRVRVTGDGWSVTIEARDAGTAHRLSEAFAEARGADDTARILAALSA